MSNITRSEYQMLVKEKEQLESALKAIAKLDDNSLKALMFWRGYFLGKKLKEEETRLKQFNELKSKAGDLFRIEYKVFETVQCECRHEAPIGFAVCNEDGNWTCANCIIEHAKEKN